MSIALEVCRMAEQQVSAAQMANVVTVGLDVGDDAGLEIDNLQFCLEALLVSPPFQRAKPAISRVTGDALRLTYLELDDERTT